MPSIEELLNEAESHMAAQPVNDVLEINPETREISIPDSEIILGVETDQKAERKYFHCPKIVGNNIDLSALELYVVFQNASNKEEGKDRYHVTDVKTTSDGYITFSWELSEKVTAYKGDVQFVVCAIKTDSSGVKQNVWNTTIAIGKCLIGLSSDMSESEEQSASDLYTQLISELNSTASAKLAEVTTQIQAVGNNQVSNVNSAGTTQVNNVQNKGTEVLASIPDTYAELDASVKQLNEQIRGKAPVITESTTIQSGSPTTVTDSAEMPLQGLNVYGKSKQVVTAGKNLLNPYLKESTTVNGITCVPNGDGTYTLNGTATKKADFIIFTVYKISSSSLFGKTLKMVGCPPGGKTDSKYALYLQRQLAPNYTPVVVDEGNGSSSLEINDSVDGAWSAWIRIYSGYTCNNLVFKPMITTDLSATYDDFEPYTGGKPSPSPDYPQEIVSVGQKLSTGKNLINADEYYSQFKQSDGTYKGENTVINKITIPLAHFVGKKIVISANIDFPSTIDTMQIRAAIGENNYYGDIVYPNTNKKSVLTVTVQTQNDNFWFIYGSGSGQVIISDIQVELGSTATSYEPYTGGKPAPYKTDCGIEITGKNLLGLFDFYKCYVDSATNKFTANNSSFSYSCETKKLPEKIILSGNNINRKNISYTNKKPEAGTLFDIVNVEENPITIKKEYKYINIQIAYGNAPDNVQIEKGTEATSYEPYKQSTATIPLQNGLPGIPVSSGGNYTDENGQQYICDEIDFSRGKYVQRVWQAEFDGSEDEVWTTANNEKPFRIEKVMPEDMYYRTGFCNQYKSVSLFTDTGIVFGVHNATICMSDSGFYDKTLPDRGLSKWKAYLAERPLKVMTYLDTPIETDLTEAQIQAYKSLTTFKPTSIISNDANAQMNVEYACDTKTWVTNKINTLIKEATTS